MKKNRINAFTLVEMLIVIVIIGILIAALMPRMQAAQWRARDVSRKTALSQIQSAIVTSQWDKWEWPWQCAVDGSTTPGCAQFWIWITTISWDLTRAWMNSVPVDPLKTEDITWLWNFTGNDKWDFAYLVTTRNWTEDWWFILMAKTEVEWSSNWVSCPSPITLSGWNIVVGEDITNIHPCTSFEKDEDDSDGETCKIEWEKCYYSSDSQLRYIVLY